jgi:hypothetical protein
VGRLWGPGVDLESHGTTSRPYISRIGKDGREGKVGYHIAANYSVEKFQTLRLGGFKAAYSGALRGAEAAALPR